MPCQESLISPISRRSFFRGSTLILAASGLPVHQLRAAPQSDDPQSNDSETLRVGLITDLHYADKPPAGSRHYRETLKKFGEAQEHFAAQEIRMIVELGDLIDAADSVSTELGYLKTINKEFSAASEDRHYVLGNHCVDTLKKEEFLGAVGQPSSYYSFDRGGYHFVVLDSCFRSDGVPYERRNFTWTDPNVSPEELEWLRADLASNKKPTIVFAHQRLDVNNSHGVKNGAAVREILETAGVVQAVFQGHSHQNDLKTIGGIHYCTLVAMVEGSGIENSGYSLLNLKPDGSIEVEGFRKQQDYRWQEA